MQELLHASTVVLSLIISLSSMVAHVSGDLHV
jgi:hypothetical protein